VSWGVAAVALELEVIQKRGDQHGVEILDVEAVRPDAGALLSEREQQAEVSR
jgi:hypothetical protein